MMKKIVIVLLIPFLLGLLACNLPWTLPEETDEEAMGLQQTLTALQTLQAEVLEEVDEPTPVDEPIEEPTPEPIPTEPPITPNFAYEGVSFLYGADIAANAWGETIPEYIPAEVGLERAEPEHILVHFNNYVDPMYYHDARILIYPVDRLIELEESAYWHVSTLQSLVTSRPPEPTDFPFLPIWNAGAMFRSNISYLDFQNGSGIRYLTQYGQALYPVNNTAIFYTFQGITADGRWYISAILPVDHPSLLATGDEVGNDWAPYYEETAWDAYINEEVSMLNSQDPNSFSPSLQALDAMIETLLIER
jgi:hypothetical protein